MTDLEPEEGPGCALAVLISIGFVLAVGLGLVLLVSWTGHRDEAGMTRVETVATTSTTRATTTTSTTLDPDRGWPDDWPTQREIALIALSLHMDRLAEAEAEVDASSMAIERQPSGEVIVTNPPEAPIADEAARSIICDGRTWDCDTALRVVRCESTFDPGAVGGAGERGWFQIHPVHRPRLGATWDLLFDPTVNTEVAYSMWREQGWLPWACYRGGGQ